MKAEADMRFVAWSLDALDRFVRLTAGILLITVTLVIFLNASGRFTIGMSFLGGEELARLLIVWTTFLAAYCALRAESHVSIDLGLRTMHPRLQRFARGLTAAIGIVVCIYLCVVATQLTIFSFRSGQMGSTLPVYRGLFFMPVAIGFALMTLAFTEKLVRALTGTLPDLPALVDDSEAVPPPAETPRP